MKLVPGNAWDTISANTYERRSKFHMYFNLSGDSVILHLMDNPQETWSIAVRDGQAIVSLSWPIHAGTGINPDWFVRTMGGENQSLDDMDPKSLNQIA